MFPVYDGMLVELAQCSSAQSDVESDLGGGASSLACVDEVDDMASLNCKDCYTVHNNFQVPIELETTICSNRP